MTSPATPFVLPAFLDAIRQAGGHPLNFRDAGLPFAEWLARARAAWREALPPHDALPLTEQSGETVRFRFATGAVAEGVLRRPAGNGPHPAVLLLHDHGGAFDRGWRKMFAGTADPAALARHYGGVAPGDYLLARGFAVLSVDALGWGARQAGGYDGQQALASAAMHLGMSLAGIVAAEDAQAARWLSAQPGISSVGAFGFSYGGLRAWQVAAIAPEVRATVSLSWMARRAPLLAPEQPLLRGHSAFWMLHPSLSRLMDFPDMAGAGAGKPLFLRSGTHDPHMPVAAVGDAYDDLRRIWRAEGHGILDAGFFEGGHVCDPAVSEAAASFLTTHLN